MKKQITVNLSIARSCFVQCNGCYNHFSEKKDLIANNVIIDFLKSASAEGIKKATICGGDPLSRTDILELLVSIKQLDFYIAVDTVGTPLLGDVNTIFYGRYLVNKIDSFTFAKHVDLVGIPLDGNSNDVVNSFRKGRPHIFDEQLNIIDILSKSNAKICINTVVHKMNIHAIEPLIPIIKSFPNVLKWQFFQFMPIGVMGCKNKDIYSISDSEFISFKEKIKDSSLNNNLNTELEFKSSSSRKNSYVLIDSNGDAWMPNYSISDKNDFACSTNKKLVIGNIGIESNHKTILEAILKSHKLTNQ